MTEYAHVENNIATTLLVGGAVIVPTGGRLPVRALAGMTEPQRNAIACYTVLRDTTPIPANKKANGSELFYDQGPNTVTRRPVLVDKPVGERKDEMRDQVDVKRDDQIALGYSHDFGAGLGGVHVLDTNQRLASEWLNYRNACKELIDAGQGSSVMTLPIRTKAEVDLAVRANQGMTAMQGMRTREGTIIAHARSLRDQIRLAADHAALDAININAGWPA